VVGNWEKCDVPIDEHRRHFETCPFLQGVDVGNVPVKPLALTGGYDICERQMRRRIYSQNYIDFRLRHQGRTPKLYIRKKKLALLNERMSD